MYQIRITQRRLTEEPLLLTDARESFRIDEQGNINEIDFQSNDEREQEKRQRRTERREEERTTLQIIILGHEDPALV